MHMRYMKAFRKLIPSIKDLKKFHGIMTKYLVKNVGSFIMEKRSFLMEVNVFLSELSGAICTLQLMDELFEWMKKSRNSVHPLIMSSVFHYERLSLFIHLLMVTEEWQDFMAHCDFV